MDEDTQGLLELQTEKEILFPFRIYPKQRAKANHSTGAHFTPAPYRAWLKRSAEYLKTQWQTLPCHLMHIYVDMKGKQKGDTDNCLGGLLDAMVHAGIVVDDDMKNIPDEHIVWNKEGRKESPSAIIYLTNIQYFPEIDEEIPPKRSRRSYSRRVKH